MTERTRLPALDALRGLAVAGMILVVTPGDWAAAYPQLRHAEWNGWTLADLVFPVFLFSVGVAMGLSFPRDWATAADRQLFWCRAMRRVGLLILLGLVLEATYNWELLYTGSTLGRPSLASLRIPGVLQRIALCYLLAALVLVGTAGRDRGGREGAVRAVLRPGAVLATTLAALLAYWAVLRLVPVPGIGTGRLDPAGYLGGYIDRQLFTVPHLWPLGWAVPGGPAVYDPEGLLSTLPATTNTLFGAIAGWGWVNRPRRVAWRIAAGGAVLLAAGLLLDPAVPLNKRIWSSSFALFSSGASALLFAALIGLVAQRRGRMLTAPLRVLGGNAILAFIVSTLLGRVYDLPVVRTAAGRQAPRGWLDGAMLRLLGEPHLAATACALLFTALMIVLLAPLHRFAVHFRL